MRDGVLMRGPVVSFRQQCVACSLLCESQEWRALLLKEGVESPLRVVSVASRQALFRLGTGVRVRSRKACQTSRRHRVLFGLQRQGCRFGRLHERSSSPVRTAVPRCRFGSKEVAGDPVVPGHDVVMALRGSAHCGRRGRSKQDPLFFLLSTRGVAPLKKPLNAEARRGSAEARRG